MENASKATGQTVNGRFQGCSTVLVMPFGAGGGELKIKETIERECCEQRDLKDYRGEVDTLRRGLKFCIHCGQLFHTTSQTDAAGGIETVLEKIKA